MERKWFRTSILCLVLVMAGILFVTYYYAEIGRPGNKTQKPQTNITHIVDIIQQQGVVQAVLVRETSTNVTLDILQGTRTVLGSYERGYLEEFVIRIANGRDTGWPYNRSMYPANRIVTSDWQFGQLLSNQLVEKGEMVNFTVYRDVWEPEQYWFPARWICTERQTTNLRYDPDHKELAIISYSSLDT